MPARWKKLNIKPWDTCLANERFLEAHSGMGIIGFPRGGGRLQYLSDVRNRILAT
jgi:hypothetical protein